MAKVTRTFSLNPEVDRDLLHWLQAQKNVSQAIRDALRLAAGASVAQPGAPGHTDLLSDDLLGAIRATMEAVLDERLASATLGVVQRPPENEDPDVAAKLDAMF